MTHGPVCTDGTDSLYGTMRVVAFVRKFKEWASVTLLSDWTALLRSATEKTKELEASMEGLAGRSIDGLVAS